MATGFEILKDSKFSIVLLDESSQMIEPQRCVPPTLSFVNEAAALLLDADAR